MDEAEQQLEFLNEVRSSLGKIPELLYLGALLASSQRKPSEEIVALVDEAAQLHFDNLKVHVIHMYVYIVCTCTNVHALELA